MNDIPVLIMENINNYGVYNDLVLKGYQAIDSKDFTVDNIDNHFQWIINILSDGIETPWVQSMMIKVNYIDGEYCEFTIFDYTANLMYYPLLLRAGEEIDSKKIWWVEDITSRKIGNYINSRFIRRYNTTIPFINMNQYIDSIFTKFIKLQNFQLYLANTINLRDHVDMMNASQEFCDTIHWDATGIPMEDVKEAGLEIARLQIEMIKNSHHCLRDSFRTGEAISPKQFKEVYVNIGTKPNGNGGVYPTIVNRSLVNGGLMNPEDNVIESSIGRIALILAKTNVGVSGNFARILGLNCQDTRIHPDPNYICDSQNFIEVSVDDDDHLRLLDMRWYRLQKNGIDKLIDATRDKYLIGKTIYLRSPMTCNSFAHGEGICYRCYGNLAFMNANINPGKYAAENLSSRFTQILLSAKHLLESNIRATEWVGPMLDVFGVVLDSICLREDIDYTGYYIKIDNIDNEEDYDDVDYNYYVTSFDIISPSGESATIHTVDSDSIYLQPDIAEIALKMMSKSEDEIALLDLKELYRTNHVVLFKIQIKNDEIQATMNKIKNIINVKAETSKYDKDSFLKEFMDTNLKGGIMIDSVHHEVILANQLRSGDSEQEFPDWSVPDQENYQILTLNMSLLKSPRLMTRLLYTKLPSVLIDPSTYRINRPSDNDVYAMQNPMEYLNKTPEIHSGEHNALINDDDKNVRKMIKPIMEWKDEAEYLRWIEEQDKTTVY